MNKKATVKAVCISRAKGTPKEPVPHIDLIEDYGIEGDAHAGKWHRQVSLLSYETIENFKAEMAGASPLVTDGSFGENIIIEGIDFKNLSVGTKLQIGQTELLITQIGKECHSQCIIGQTVGRCIMPEEGVFARVLTGGKVEPGEDVTVL